MLAIGKYNDNPDEDEQFVQVREPVVHFFRPVFVSGSVVTLLSVQTRKKARPDRVRAADIYTRRRRRWTVPNDMEEGCGHVRPACAGVAPPTASATES